jgi:hypothetical protein
MSRWYFFNWLRNRFPEFTSVFNSWEAECQTASQRDLAIMNLYFQALHRIRIEKVTGEEAQKIASAALECSLRM